MPTRRERRDKPLNPKKDYKKKPWNKSNIKKDTLNGIITRKEEGKKSRRFKSVRDIEIARTKVKEMGLDSSFAVELLKKGVPMEELKLLATGDANTFLKRNGRKLSKKHWKYIKEKYRQ